MAEARDHDPFSPADVSPRQPLLAAGGILALVLTAVSALWLTYTWNVPAGRQTASAPAPGPQLQIDPAAEREHVLGEQRARLAGYRWIDRDRGVIAIPIERAMQIIAGRGTQAYAPIESDARPQPGAGARP
jgi:hypothetical protein